MANVPKIFILLFFVLTGFAFFQPASAADSVLVRSRLKVVIEATCNNNLVCEMEEGETFASCPSDCGVCDTHGDLNKDGSIDITDFSILMYFWGQSSPSNACADINQDGIVDIIDFSIMLYWWTN